MTPVWLLPNTRLLPSIPHLSASSSTCPQPHPPPPPGPTHCSWMEKHADPSFALHTMMAEYWGKMGLRIADSMVSS
jgi:hypothetical protein